MLPKQNAFQILDVVVQTMIKTKPSNRNYYTIQTNAIKKARSGLKEWGYRGDQVEDLIQDALDMAKLLRPTK